MEYDHIPIISVAPENIDEEHICCAMSDKKSADGVEMKKMLMNSLF